MKFKSLFPSDEYSFLLKRETVYFSFSLSTRRDQVLIWVLGGPGSGKGTQCKLVKKEFDAEHLIPGEMLRREASRKTELGCKIESILMDGRIVPPTVTVPLLKEAIAATDKKIVLIDGFPRDLENREEFHRSLQRDCDLLLVYECSEAELLRRLKKRGETSGRSDDNENTILKRFSTFQRRTVPVIDLYRNSGKLKIVDGSKGIVEVSRRTTDVIRAVEKQQLPEELGTSNAG
ncbi:hypothetical protein NDN08_008332 [Rhodosorus marinus]|uniref:Adenylate kinase n=1 Tax=Rhodosorus marinus TaxID=101924 RepID=A0AAV8V0A1_9RHOD|nr:hypothetical protein NDN08_008332 [Rhodosorus marinus]